MNNAHLFLPLLAALTGLAPWEVMNSRAVASELAPVYGPGTGVVVVTNAIMPDNQHVFTNLQTAINMVCSNNFGGGTIICGTGEFYRPAGYFFPSNQYFCVRITGQSPGGTWITADTNLFYLEGSPGVGSEVTIDNVACHYKNTNWGFMLWLDQDSKNTIRNCWLMNYADLTNSGPQEWAHSGVCTVPQGVALGADHYRCIDN